MSLAYALQFRQRLFNYAKGNQNGAHGAAFSQAFHNCVTIPPKVWESLRL
jgi:hypothetical protein